MDNEKSQTWENWLSILDLRTCLPCRKKHGKIFDRKDYNAVRPPAHENCRCRMEALSVRHAGYATVNGNDGADWAIKHKGELPAYYLSKEEAQRLGWRPFLGNLADVAPGRMIDGGVYFNRSGTLPDAPGRVRYEADINYTEGYRGNDRILYSNDGLIFVTYDHYITFSEVV